MRELHYGVNQRCRGRVLEDIAYEAAVDLAALNAAA